MSSNNKSIFESRKFKEAMKFVYGFGGAIVILGAMFKITHWPGATEMLVAGLTTEALIFIISSFEPLHEEPDWGKVYPQLRHEHEVSEEMETAMEEATYQQNVQAGALMGMRLDDTALDKLSVGIQAIAKQAESLANITALAGSVDRFSQILDQASNNIEKISSSAVGFSGKFEDAINVDFRSLAENIQVLSQTIHEVNTIYHHQAEGINQDYNVATLTSERFQEVVNTLDQVAHNAMEYKIKMQELASNIDRINGVYQQVLAQVESELPEERLSVFTRLFNFFTGRK